MPLLLASSYRAPPFLSDGRLQTVYPRFFRKIPLPGYARERIITPDGDFLDLDWARTGARRLAVLTHGLEGDSSQPYMRGMARAFNRGGWDALAWNLRGCSGEPNRLSRFYHSGETEDLRSVLAHAASLGTYRELVLIGFSLGGNITLKLLGEGGLDAFPLRAALAFSVPCDLASSCARMASPDNRLFMASMLRDLRRKLTAKRSAAPDLPSLEGFEAIRSFKEFDDRYTAPLHGFRDAEDYWRRSSCKPWLGGIRIPTLLVNALNDPFLAAECFPEAEARANPNLFLEAPAGGGHVGFVSFGNGGLYWSETRALEFVEKAA